jgi:hypothetical protein
MVPELGRSLIIISSVDILLFLDIDVMGSSSDCLSFKGSGNEVISHILSDTQVDLSKIFGSCEDFLLELNWEVVIPNPVTLET